MPLIGLGLLNALEQSLQKRLLFYARTIRQWIAVDAKAPVRDTRSALQLVVQPVRVLRDV